jgi:hypothetical protein
VTRSKVLFASTILAAAAALFASKAAAKMPDFEVYWRAAVRARTAEPLYRSEDQHYQLKYLPAFAVLAIPAGLLPLITAKAIWFGVSAGLLCVLVAMSLRVLPARRKAGWLLCGATVVLMAKFYGHELVLGQVNLLFAVIVMAAVESIQRGRAGTAGLLLALAVVIKPYAVLFLPWLAAQREAKALAAAGAGLAGALLLPAIVYGAGGTLALHLDWWRTVTESTAPNLLNADNVSLAAMFAKWIGIGRTAAGLAAATGALLLGVAAAAFARRRTVPLPHGLEAALLLTLVPLLSPQGWDYVFLLATPAVMYLVNYDRDLPPPVRYVTWAALGAAAFSLYDVMGRAAYGRFMALSVVSVCFVVAVGSLAALRFNKVA